MKLILVLVYLGLSLATLANDVLENRGKFTPPKVISGVEELNKVLFSEARLENEQLKKVKYYLINGESRLARTYLNRLSYSQSKLRPIINRYHAMLSFIEGNYADSLKYASLPELQNIPHFSKICVMKTLTLIILDKKRHLEEEWTKCKQQNITNFNASHIPWLETLVQLKVRPTRGITRGPFEKIRLSRYEEDDLKILLKLALYLNQEELVAPLLTDLTVVQLQDQDIREIAGMIYFRQGIFTKAYKFIDELASPNSENIKGNLYVLRKKYELAYAQYKLALEQKQNSQNAMERLLPLAWILKDWKNGSIYAERVIASPQTQINKLTLLAAFLMQKGDYTSAKKILHNIAISSRRGSELDVTQVHSFVALMQNQPEEVARQAELSCAQFDLMNCWVAIQMKQWDNFPLTIRRDEQVASAPIWEKLTKEKLDEPLKETVYINQLDIEEMDDRLIRLTPKAP